jgi:hypothetical protein
MQLLLVFFYGRKFFFLDLIAEVKRSYKVTGFHFSQLQGSRNILWIFSAISSCFLYIFKNFANYYPKLLGTMTLMTPL